MPVDTVDYQFKKANIYKDSRSGFLKKLKLPFWDKFFIDRIKEIFENGGLIVDIGGGIRIDGSRGNKINEKNKKEFSKYLSNPNVKYKVTDYTDKYSPDFVEDIHNLSFQDGSIDSIFCIAILEHVYDPKKATGEMVRVLKDGGMGLIYVPFIYRYHSHKDDYKDYFRYSKDGIAYLFRDCDSIEICPVRGIFESLLRFLPLHNFAPFKYLMRMIDIFTPQIRRVSETQTSGYFIFIKK
ncbi:methyltransferase domain-containing protein [Candidatus Peregrinibacteria bacterium]|nr:methyltransferase domain-containing protein [Candidatus Peregrinibacteria bacterium]MBT6730805.1 methyltransferase domain-containing protein [Candidatus Peregrinibacteria bacterium]